MKHYIHDNGRRCQRGSDMIWRHWDHEQTEPGPADVVHYVCRMDHWLSRQKEGPLPPMEEEHSSDRGDFGAPTVGQVAREMLTGAVFTAGPSKIVKIIPDSFKMIVKKDGIFIDYGENGLDVDAETPDARYILAAVLPKLLEHFLIKNGQYARAQSGHDLGLKGIIPDINRKSAALITRIWDNDNMYDAGQDETQELIDDLIGHLLLMRAKMR
jgi:hypothetical protein